MGLYIFVDEEEPQEAHMQVSGTGLCAGGKQVQKVYLAGQCRRHWTLAKY